ncbi:MAG: enoyl-CoA hydratase [Gemmatimonadota bacterium]|nr:enoyl-CoA hydratase [Gemmatimonadota bacterium]
MHSPQGGDAAIRFRTENGTAWITLNRPERLNAFAGTMRDDLLQALECAADDRATRVVVIGGAGRGFCAGADVEVISDLLARGDEEAFAELVSAGTRVVRRLRSLPCPVVAAVNGPAAGAGASLAIACDLRIASSRASIGFTFNRIGLHPDWGATYRLPRLVGAGRASELILSGRMVAAEEAERIGLFERVVPDERFPDEVQRLADELTAKPPLAMAAAKRSLWRSPDAELEEMMAVEAEAQLRCFRSSDVREGIAAFHERRPPIFTGA